VPLTTRMRPIGQTYELPNAMTVKRTIDCPASAVVNKPESIPTPMPAITPATSSSTPGSSP
jgi:soluble lytic murein transglycosylase